MFGFHRWASFTLLLTPALAIAGGPLENVSDHLGTVRIMSGLTGPSDVGSSIGSGVLIGNKRVGDNGWLIVLTADHVISTTGAHDGATRANIGIGIGSAAAGSSTGFATSFVSRSGPNRRVDIAVMAHNYGAFNANFNGQVRSIKATDPARPPSSFTGVGYGMGLEADANRRAWMTNNDIGQRRFYNVGSFTISAQNEEFFGGYRNRVIRHIAADPRSPNTPSGFGVPYKGDSGCPYFTETERVQRVGTQDIGTWANGVFGIHHGSVFRTENGAPVGINYGSDQWGVYLDQGNRQRIQQQVEAVPEPSTLIALGFGTLCWLRRRPKARGAW